MRDHGRCSVLNNLDPAMITLNSQSELADYCLVI